MEKKALTLEERIISKREKINHLESRMNNLSKKKSKLNTELMTLEALQKAKKFEVLEISLKDSGMTLEELMATIKGGGNG